MVAPIPQSLVSCNPFKWLTVFGPGAIMASLTIGTGELIFSSRGGVLFGYRILFLFLVISLFKWTLVFSMARHMVLTGVHPLRRWMELPIGPRGWLPTVFFIFAVVCIPIWVSFHSSVLGDLLAGISGTKQFFNGATIHLWGAGVLALVLGLTLAGGYKGLEKAQLIIVASMLAAVVGALFLFDPDWLELFRGAFIPQTLRYPEWLLNDPRPAIQQIADRPVWVETTLYVGVIGGASYDYLAYTSFLREKSWGLATTAEGKGGLTHAAEIDCQNLRQWVRAPLIDCTLSFLVVIAFSAVFVASGKLVLAPAHQIPGDGAFLEHQAQFVTRLHPWLYPLYVVGALLAMLGTLYGTVEVAPTVLRETVEAVGFKRLNKSHRRLRVVAIGWCTCGAFIVLGASFLYQLRFGADKPPGLTNILIPANLFTGVLSCGLICLLNPWIDRNLPRELKTPVALTILNVAGGIGFVLLGLKGYWDFAGWHAMLILLATVAGGCVVALLTCRSE